MARSVEDDQETDSWSVNHWLSSVFIADWCSSNMFLSPVNVVW